MYTAQTVVKCASGLHNKQATYFIQKANDFKSSICRMLDVIKKPMHLMNKVRYQVFSKNK